MLEKSRAWRLGRNSHVWRPRKGIERRRVAPHKQPHGIDGGDFSAGNLETPVFGRSLYRQRIYARRHHRLDQWLEEKRLAHRRQEASEERRSVEGAPGRRAAPATAPGLRPR